MAMKKVTKKTTKVTSMFKAEDFNKMGVEYDEISAHIKDLDGRKKVLADSIKKGAEQLGVKDDKGSYYLECDDVILGKVAKTSLKIDHEKGVEILKEKGLKNCIKKVTTTVVDEEALDQAVQSGKISLEEVEEFVTRNVSYSVSVKKKEEMPAVEQTTLKSVAKRK